MAGYAGGPRRNIRWGPHHAYATRADSISKRSGLLLVTALDARPLQQLAVLLLRHPLTPLLNDRAHDLPSLTSHHSVLGAGAHTTYEGPAYPSAR